MFNKVAPFIHKLVGSITNYFSHKQSNIQD